MRTVQQATDSLRQHIPHDVSQSILLKTIDKLIDKCTTCGSDPASLSELLVAVRSSQKTINEANRHYYIALTRLWRAVEQCFPASIGDLIDPSLFTSAECTAALNRAVLDHLLRDGHEHLARTCASVRGR